MFQCHALTMHVSVLVYLLLATSVKYVSPEKDENQCPPWFLFDLDITISSAPKPYSHCVCSAAMPTEIACNSQEYTSHVSLGTCAFWINNTEFTTGDTIVGPCPYVFPLEMYENHVIELPRDVHDLNSFLCTSLTRETGHGVCGRCANGTGPSVTSVGNLCVDCSRWNVLYYVLLHYVPATVIFLLILIVQFNITSSYMAHYVLYCNALAVFMQMPGGFPTYLTLTVTSYRHTLRALLVLDSLWSFDPLYFLSPPLCLYANLEDIHMLYIEMIKTLYPFILLLLAYVCIELHGRDFKPVVVLWRPVQRSLVRFKSSWNPHASLVQAFATIFFISYVKMLFLVSIPFNWTDFITDRGTTNNSLRFTYIDPTLPILHPKHTTAIATSITVFAIIIVPPIVLLVVYPTRLFRKFQNHLSPRVTLALKIFVGTFQGNYKDGMNGTRDYRAFPGGLLLGILLLMVIHYSWDSFREAEYRPVVSLQITVILLIICTVVVAVLRPHKSETANNVVVCLCALVGMGAAVHIFIAAYFTANIRVILMACIVMSVPHFVLYGYVCYKILSKFHLLRRVFRVGNTEQEVQGLLIQQT